jgi:soluble lytic murein transglycosylase-like protein
LSTALLVMVAGCSTSGGGLNAALEPSALQVEPADREAAEGSLAWENSPLPQAVPFAPTARPEFAALGDDGLPPVQAVGYAGATPTSPIAAAIASPAALAVAKAAGTIAPPAGRLGPASVAARSPELDLLIAKYAAHYEVPEALVRRVVNRESTFNPKARNGPYWGLMQILPATARGMGHTGKAADLLDAETNLKYAVRYLRGAYLVAGGNHDLAVRFYARGYYYDAKAKGLLDETGLGTDRRRRAR